MKEIRNFINGEFVATAKTFEKRSPLDNQLIAQVCEAGGRRSMPPLPPHAPRSRAVGAHDRG